MATKSSSTLRRVWAFGVPRIRLTPQIPRLEIAKVPAIGVSLESHGVNGRPSGRPDKLFETA